jgi:hypothetical protein
VVHDWMGTPRFVIATRNPLTNIPYLLYSFAIVPALGKRTEYIDLNNQQTCGISVILLTRGSNCPSKELLKA